MFIILGFLRCTNNWNWEDVTSDYIPELNVFGLISLDEKIPTFVQIHKTLGLEGPTWKTTNKDTIWYGPGPYDYWIDEQQESLYDVKDASVFISDGEKDFPFSLLSDFDPKWELYPYLDEAIYFDQQNQFFPEPNRTYYLSVTTPDGLSVMGEVTTPPIPQLHTNLPPDTVYHKKTYSITWDPLFSVKVSIRTTVLYHWLCGSNQIAILNEGDSSWTSSVENCERGWIYDTESEADSIQIEIRSMDNNYYQYFIKHAYDQEFVNFLLGGGASGYSFGVEGGLGVFGAIATDRIYRVFVP